jgi:hypothetical protein
MEVIAIQYRFTLPDGSQELFSIELNAETLETLRNSHENLPVWTHLSFHQCPHCPLSGDTSPYCPLAASLVRIVQRFGGLFSYEKMRVEVSTQERSIFQDTTIQRGISSLMGLLIPTSGCPHTVFFKPMARFHLPLATEEETVYRATSMYLLAQYFRRKNGENPDLELQGLSRIYRDIELVNTAVARRLRAASEADSTVNAITLLDIYAKALPFGIHESLEDIRYLFAPFLLANADSMLQRAQG